MKEPDSVFVPGETIDLCAPTREDVAQSGWFRWFNDPKTTRVLNQGIYPNSVEAQMKYYEGLPADPTRIVLLIRPKGSHEPVGVVSLSHIDYRVRRAEIAIVKGERAEEHNLHALEALARLTEHGFERVGMRCLVAGQAWPVLEKWQQRLELIGYRCDGILRKGWAKGYREYDVAYITCLLEDYIELKRIRNGQYWPGVSRMHELIAALPETGYGSILESVVRKTQEDYFAKLKLA